MCHTKKLSIFLQKNRRKQQEKLNQQARQGQGRVALASEYFVQPWEVEQRKIFPGRENISWLGIVWWSVRDQSLIGQKDPQWSWQLPNTAFQAPRLGELIFPTHRLWISQKQDSKRPAWTWLGRRNRNWQKTFGFPDCQAFLVRLNQLQFVHLGHSFHSSASNPYSPLLGDHCSLTETGTELITLSLEPISSPLSDHWFDHREPGMDPYSRNLAQESGIFHTRPSIHNREQDLVLEVFVFFLE